MKQNNMFFRFLKILTISLLLFSKSAFGDDKKRAMEFVNDFGSKAVEIASNEKITVDARRDQIIDLVDSIVDSKWVSKFVLAKNYRIATKEQRNRFQGLYRDFMIHTYAPSFKGYSGENFKTLKVIQQGKYFMVKCLFLAQEGPSVNLSFRLKKNKNDNSFSVLDVIAEGVSLIETQRSEFGSVISNKGMEGFLSDMESRVTKLKSNSKKPAKSKN